MGAKASRWLTTLDLTKHVDGATVELIWDEYDQNHTGYLEGDEVDRLLKHWCAIHKISNFEQVRNEFWERFDVNKDGRIAKVNLLGGSMCTDKDSGERDKASAASMAPTEDHKLEDFKKPRGSLPGVRKKSSELGERGSAVFGVSVDRSAAEQSAGVASSSSSSHISPVIVAPRRSLFGLRNSGGVENINQQQQVEQAAHDTSLPLHQPRGSLFGLRNTDIAGHEHRSSLFGLRTSSGDGVTSTEHRGSLFDLNKARGGAVESARVPSPTLTSDQKINITASTVTSGSSSSINSNNTNNSNTHHMIPELNLRGPRASLPSTTAPKRVAKTRRSLPNPTLAKVFSFLHDSTASTTTTITTATTATTSTSRLECTPSNLNINNNTISSNIKSPVTPHARGTSPFRVFDLLSARQNPHTPSANTNVFPALLITGPTKPLPLAAQALPEEKNVENEVKNEMKVDVNVAVSNSFPSYLSPGDCIDKDLLRSMLSVSVPEFVLELELGRLHAHSVVTLADAHRLSLQDLEGIVRPGLARGLHEFLHERRSSLSSPTLTPYRNSPNHSRSSQFREKLQGRTSVSWGSLSRSEKESNNNPLDLLEPPARFRPSKRFVFNAPPLAGDDLLLSYPTPTARLERNVAGDDFLLSYPTPSARNDRAEVSDSKRFSI